MKAAVFSLALLSLVLAGFSTAVVLELRRVNSLRHECEMQAGQLRVDFARHLVGAAPSGAAR